MTENFQDKLHLEECNNQKVQRFLPVLEEHLSVENARKLSANICKAKHAKTNKCKTFH